MPKYLNFIKNLTIFSVLLLLIFLAEWRTDGFRTSKIFFEKPSKWKVNQITNEAVDEIKSILDQEFTYLGRGRQCFAFESSDHKYVLKFINYSNVSYPSFFKAFPIKVLQNSLKRKDERCPLTFSSMVLAYENLQDETGLIYVNLNDVKLKKRALFKNKYGQSLKIDLDKTCFILQKKAEPLFPSLEELYLKEKNKGLEKGIDEFLKVIIARCKKNIADDDFNAEMNIGFYNKKAIIIDTGKLYRANLEEKQALRKEVFYATKFLRIWLEKNHKEVLPYLEKRISEVLSF